MTTESTAAAERPGPSIYSMRCPTCDAFTRWSGVRTDVGVRYTCDGCTTEQREIVDVFEIETRP